MTLTLCAQMRVLRISYHCMVCNASLVSLHSLERESGVITKFVHYKNRLSLHGLQEESGSTARSATKALKRLKKNNERRRRPHDSKRLTQQTHTEPERSLDTVKTPCEMPCEQHQQQPNAPFQPLTRSNARKTHSEQSLLR